MTVSRARDPDEVVLFGCLQGGSRRKEFELATLKFGDSFVWGFLKSTPFESH